MYYAQSEHNIQMLCERILIYNLFFQFFSKKTFEIKTLKAYLETCSNINFRKFDVNTKLSDE